VKYFVDGYVYDTLVKDAFEATCPRDAANLFLRKHNPGKGEKRLKVYRLDGKAPEEIVIHWSHRRYV
jgi:hypothetical protein